MGRYRSNPYPESTHHSYIGVYFYPARRESIHI